MSANPFLRTKFYIPPYRAEWLPRPDLIALLNAGLPRKLILLSAPAGFGKTSLLCEWIQRVRTYESQKPRTQFVWLALDEGDNDTGRFLAYITKALRSIYPSGNEEELSNLWLGQMPSIQTVLDRLINAVDEQQRRAPEGSRIVLILDDYHIITAEDIHQSLAYLLDHLPPQMNLVIATRGDPPLPLARLRARGEVLEMRAAELRFTKDEVRELLNRALGFILSEIDLNALENRTEGWIAGLQMAILAMQSLAVGEETEAGLKHIRAVDTTHYSTFIQQLSGSNRYIMDYLIEEVLQRQSESVQDFLLKTSILERMCGPLCAAVIAAPQDKDQPADLSSAYTILNYLDRANLFVFPLDDQREWYRYHRLFADLLRKRLKLAYPEQIQDFNRRAGDWFEQHGAVEEAVEHAFAANDEKRAADLVAQVAEGLLIRSEFLTLQRWLDRLPDEQIATRPELCVFHAWTLFLSNAPLRKVEERLALIQAYDERQMIKAAPLRAYIAIYRGSISQASLYARQALEGLPKEDIFLRSMASVVLASCELSEGDPEVGFRVFEEAIHSGGQTGNILASVIALVSLAENYRKLGQLYKAETLYRQAIDLAVDSRGKRLPVAGRALSGLGDLMREWNQLEVARHYLEEGIELLENWGVLAIYTSYIALAKVMQAQKNLAGAMDIILKVRQLAAETKATPIDDWIVEMMQASLWIANGNLDFAEAWVERRELLHELDPEKLSASERFAYVHLRKYELTVLARLRLAQDRSKEALQLLDALLPEVIKLPRLGLRVEIQVLRALSFYSQGNQAEAFSALEAALSLAEPAGYVRLFLDEGNPMYRLLSEAHRRDSSAAYVARLLAAFERDKTQEFERAPGSDAQTPLADEVEPLSNREMEILTLLRSRLSVPEMADRLYLAESTVRSHIKSIYSKLSVHRRVDAVQRAEDQGLLSKPVS